MKFLKDYQLLIGLIIAALIIAWALGAFPREVINY
tara:strand:+ start:215 stop:319 length:105 start_codon:yes stop_codon:yes gene_type:complete